MRPRLKSTLNAIFDRVGYRRAATALPDERGTATDLATLFKTLKIDLVIDIGANRGAFGIFLREQVGYSGPIASFEPIPSLFASLEQRARTDPHWQVEHAAFGEAGGALPLNVIDLHNFRTASPLPDRAEPNRQSARVSRTTVPVRTLDQILPALRLQTRAKHIFLKLNAHTQDRAILKGSEQSLTAMAAMQTELFTNRQFEGVPHYLGVLSYLQAKHFSPNHFVPAGTKSGAIPTSFTCCLVNTQCRTIMPAAGACGA
jgi:FkbM family methyltransferase